MFCVGINLSGTNLDAESARKVRLRIRAVGNYSQFRIFPLIPMLYWRMLLIPQVIRRPVFDRRELWPTALDIKRMSEAVGQYKGWPRVVSEMATHFLNSTLVEISLKSQRL